MNKHLFNLRHQAIVFANEAKPTAFYKDWDEIRDTKLACLIVQDCVAPILAMKERVETSGAPPGYDKDSLLLAYKDCIDLIKEEFGVKE